MFNTTASMLYRLVKARMTWLFLAVFVILIGAGFATVKTLCADAELMANVTETSSDITLMMGVASSDAGGVSLVGLCGSLFVRGSAIAMFVAAFCAVFIATDLRSGYVKNLMQARGGRLSYALAATLVIAGVCVAYVLVGVAATVLGALITGIKLSVPAMPDFILWCIEVAAVCYAYALLAALVALLTRSSAAGVLAGLLLGGAAVENLLYSALGLVTGHPYEVRQLFDHYLAVSISQLGLGTMQPWESIVPMVATIAVALAAAAVIMKRRGLD